MTAQVEEVSAKAQSLSQMAGGLEEVVARFVLPRDGKTPLQGPLLSEEEANPEVELEFA